MLCKHLNGECRVKCVYAIILIILFLPISVSADFAGGTGEPNDPYLIENYIQLFSIKTTEYDKSYKLIADINMVAFTITRAIIAKDTYSVDGFQGTKFTGTFDGNDHSIINMDIDSSSSNDYIAFFGYIEGATIKNLNLVNVSINGGEYLGALVGYADVSTIENIVLHTVSVTGEKYIGTISGYAKDTTILSCVSDNYVSGDYYIGGIAGVLSIGCHTENCHFNGDVFGSLDCGGITGLNNGTIAKCSSYGTVETTGGDMGGLVGSNYGTIQQSFTHCNVTTGDYSQNIGGFVGFTSGGTISDCYCHGDISVMYNCMSIGGFAGRQYPDGVIENCYSTGHISYRTHSAPLGGFIGDNYYLSQVSNCFWDTQTSGRSYSDGGTGKTTVEMQTLATFTDAGWDFIGEFINGSNGLWRMCVDNIEYPRLWWEFTEGDFTCNDGVDLYDFAVLANRWGLSSSDQGYDVKYDLSDDGVINIDDFAIFAENWLIDVSL